MIYFLALLFAITFASFTVITVRNQKLSITYAVFWLSLATIITIITMEPKLLIVVSGLMGVEYPPALLFLVGILFCLVYIFKLTIAIDQQSKKLASLTQEMALVKEMVLNLGLILKSDSKEKD